MDALKDTIIAKTGIPADKADQVVETVIGFLKDNPDKLSELMGDAGPVGGVKGKLGGFLKR